MELREKKVIRLTTKTLALKLLTLEAKKSLFSYFGPDR